MTTFPQLALTLLGLLFCAGDVAMLGFLLAWQERAASPAARWHRMVRGVLPATIVLLALLLLALLLLALMQLMLLWFKVS